VTLRIRQTAADFGQSVKTMLAAQQEYDGLGQYVADQVERQMIERMAPETQEMLRPTLEKINRGVELACPVVMDLPMRVEYGLAGLSPGDAFIIAANPQNYATIGFELPNWNPTHIDKIETCGSGTFWGTVSDCIDGACSAKAEQGEDWQALLIALLGRMGAANLDRLRIAYADFRRSRDPYTMAIVAVCARRERGAAGGVVVLPLPIIDMR
jgi:hypothetical protein